MVDIATASGESSVKGGIDRVPGDAGLLEAKPSQPIDKTFYSFPTDGANYCYLDRLNHWALAAQCEPAKGQSGGGGPAESSKIKLLKDGDQEIEFASLELHTFPSWGISLIYKEWFTSISLILGKRIS